MQLKLDKLSDREKLLAVLAVACVLSLFVKGAVVQPLSIMFGDLNRGIRQTEQSLKPNKTVLAKDRKEAVINEYNRYSRLIEVPSPSEAKNEMKAEIESLAEQTKVSIVKSQERPNIKEFYEEYVIEVNVEAGMPELMSFLHGLETSPLFLRVQKMSLAGIGAKGGSTQSVLQGTLVITKLFKRDLKEPAAEAVKPAGT